MSNQAQRLRRIGESRATVRHNLNAIDAASLARKYARNGNVVRFAK